MPKINVCFEVTQRLDETYDISEEAYQGLMTDWCLFKAIGGVEKFNGLAEKTKLFGDTTTDYAVYDDQGRTIIEWD